MSAVPGLNCLWLSLSSSCHESSLGEPARDDKHSGYRHAEPSRLQQHQASSAGQGHDEKRDAAHLKLNSRRNANCGKCYIPTYVHTYIHTYIHTYSPATIIFSPCEAGSCCASQGKMCRLFVASGTRATRIFNQRILCSKFTCIHHMFQASSLQRTTWQLLDTVRRLIHGVVRCGESTNRSLDSF